MAHWYSITQAGGLLRVQGISRMVFSPGCQAILNPVGPSGPPSLTNRM